MTSSLFSPGNGLELLNNGGLVQGHLALSSSLLQANPKGAPLLGTEGDQVKALQDLQANHGVQGGLPQVPLLGHLPG